MSAPRKLRLLVMGALLACANPSEPPSAPEVAITPGAQWSGGEIALRSAAFRADRLPVLLAGAETLAVRRVSDSVVAAVIPPGPSGTIHVDLLERGVRLPLGEVARVGFREPHTLASYFTGELVTAWRGSTPVLLGGGGNLNLGLQALDLGSMLMTPLSGVFTPPVYGLSPTRVPNEFLATDSTRQVRLWRYAPLSGFIDTVPTFVNTQFLRQSVPFRDSIWLVTASHSANVRRGSAWVFNTFSPIGSGLGLAAEGSWNVFLSPHGDVATYSVNYAVPGVPVFNMETGDTAYTLGDGFHFALAAGFSGDGDRLFFLGGATTQKAESLLVVRASTGEVLGGAHVPADFGTGLVTDPVPDLVYVEAIRGGYPVVLVYDQDLKQVGELPGPATGTPLCDPQRCWKNTLAVDRARNLLHAVWALTNGSTFIWTYDLLPTP